MEISVINWGITKNNENVKCYTLKNEFLEVERVPLKDINITSLFDAKSMLAVEYAKKKRNL